MTEFGFYFEHELASELDDCEIDVHDITLFHYSFDATVNLYDYRARFQKFKNDKRITKPVEKSKKYHYEIIERTINDSPTYVPIQLLNNTGISESSIYARTIDTYNYLQIIKYENYILHDFEKFHNVSTKLIDDGCYGPEYNRLSEKIEYLDCCIPDVINKIEILKILNKKILDNKEVIEDYVPYHERKQKYKRFYELIKERKPDIYESYNLDDIRFEEIINSRDEMIDPVTLISHDLTYIHPLFYNNKLLKTYYAKNVKSNVWYDMYNEYDDKPNRLWIKRTNALNDGIGNETEETYACDECYRVIDRHLIINEDKNKDESESSDSSSSYEEEEEEEEEEDSDE